MKILDLTHLIEEALPVYPETEPPKLTPSNTFEQHGFRETLLTMGSHTGTHMDAPAHMLRDGKTLDQFPADKYIGTAYVLDCSDLAGKEIPKARLQLHASEIEAADFLLFYTGWEKYWGSEQYFSPFPVLSLEAAEYLAAFPLKGVGTARRAIILMHDSSAKTTTVEALPAIIEGYLEAGYSFAALTPSTRSVTFSYLD